MHDGDAVGEEADDAEVVRDEEHGEAEFAPEVEEEIEDLALDGDVEGADWFVGEEEFGGRGESAGDGDALALAAGEFVRVFEGSGGAEADAFHESGDAGAEGGLVELAAAGGDGFGEGAEDGEARVERGVGVLEDHLEVEPCEPEGGGVEGGEVAVFEEDPAGGERLELHDGAAEGGFAATGFADEPEDFAWGDVEGDPVDGAEGIRAFAEEGGAGGEVDADVVELEKRGHAGLWLRQPGQFWTKWPWETSMRSGSRSVRQRWPPSVLRGRKAHPGVREARSGGVPGMVWRTAPLG